MEYRHSKLWLLCYRFCWYHWMLLSPQEHILHYFLNKWLVQVYLNARLSAHVGKKFKLYGYHKILMIANIAQSNTNTKPITTEMNGMTSFYHSILRTSHPLDIL
jgi:hypothetical protein